MKTLGATARSRRRQPSTAVKQSLKNHQQLNREFARIGVSLRSTTGAARLERAASDHDSDRLRSLLEEAFRTKRPPRNFGARYRRIQAGQDELISTASIRELLAGVVGGGRIDARRWKEIMRAFELISRARFPTHWTGFATKKAVMQHPTAVGKGLFGNPGKTAKLHASLDRDRRVAVARALRAAAAEPGATLDGVVKAGLRRAISFSLNAFIAPATASNVRPYLRGRRVEGRDLRLQTRYREKLKKDFVAFGGKQRKGEVDDRRPWINDPAEVKASPPRVRRKNVGRSLTRTS